MHSSAKCKEQSRTTTPEAPGTNLNLRFRIDDGPQIQVEGTVIWVNPYRPGAPDNLRVLSCAELLTDSIRRIFTDDSVSEVFGGENQLF